MTYTPVKRLVLYLRKQAT